MVKKGNSHVNIVLPSDLWKRIRLAAMEDETSASAVFEALAEEWLAKRAKKGRKQG